MYFFQAMTIYTQLNKPPPPPPSVEEEETDSPVQQIETQIPERFQNFSTPESYEIEIDQPTDTDSKDK